MRTNAFYSLIVASCAVVAIFSACVVDKDFAIDNTDEINTEMTLFGSGVEVPLGHTEQFHLADVLKMAGDTSLANFFKADAEGKYSISASGDYDMKEVIDQMGLDKLLDLDGASFAQNIEYPLGDFSKEQFTIQGKSFNYQLPGFEPFSLDDIKIPAITCPEQVIYTELYKYMPEGLDVGAHMPKVDRNENLLAVSEINDVISVLPIPSSTEISIQDALQTLGYSSLSFSGVQEVVSGSISLGEKAYCIADVNNFKLQSGGKVTITLSADNCPLTQGKITPNLKANLSNMINLDGALPITGDIDLSTLVLTNNNGWSSSKVYTINSLADGFPAKKGDAIAISGTVDVKSGTIDITDAKSTKDKVAGLASKSLSLHVVIAFNDIVLESMDITLGNNVGFDFDPVEMPVSFNYALPKELKKVDKIILDQAKPMLLEIYSTDNLKGLKTASDHLSLVPEIEITFPEGLEVQEAVNNKVVVTGDLYDGKISKQIHILSLTPTNSKGQLSFNGDVKATIHAKATGSFNSKALPKDAASDVVLKGKISCEPKISDYNATLDLDQVSQHVSEKEEFSFEVKGLGDFGEFEIYPKSACKASVQLQIPELTELEIVAKNVIISLPEMLVVDGSGISGFNPADNTIKIDGSIPSLIEIPIQYLKVKPTTEPGGTTKVTGYLKVEGDISVNQPEITNTSIKEMSSSQTELTMVMPTIEAGSMKLIGNFNKSLDYDCKDVVFLDKTTTGKLPKEVKTMKEVTFDGVNAIVQITLDGLPTLSNGNYFHLQNTSVVLPDFLTAHDGGNTIVFDKDIRVENNKAVLTKAVLGGIKDVQLEGLTELKGDIVLNSTLYAEKPEVNLQTLQSKIVGTVKVAVGDGTGIMNPGKIAIEKAVVNVGYDVKEESVVELGNIPQELQGEDVNLALNPEITINLSTNFGAPLVGSFTFVPYIKGVALEDCKVEIKGIAMPVSKDASETLTTKYVIGANPPAQQSGVVPVVCDLSPLMKRVPDQIKLTVNATIDSEDECIIFPSAKYVCKMDYAFSVPLCFGKGMNLDLTSLVEVDSATGDYFKYGSVRLNLDIINVLPIGIKCDVKLLDDKGAEVALKQPVVLDIKPGDGNTATTQTFNPELNLVDKTNPVIRNISLKFTASATPDVAVSEDQYLQVTRMTVTLPEGVTMDPAKMK